MNEDENDSSIENFIYQEVVNRKEKERRSKIKADYIKKNGIQSKDDDVKYTPSKRDSYKKSHDMHVKEKINGERDLGAKDTMGYTRLYGKDGKRDASGWGDSQYKYTPDRKKDGIFKKRNTPYDRNNRLDYLKKKIWDNKLDHDEKERTKDVPHKDKIDKIANKIRDKYAASKAKQFEALSKNEKVPKIIRDYANSPKSNLNQWATHHYITKMIGSKNANKPINRASSVVNIAYDADRAISKGAKKAKDVAKKFVANKLKHNRSAKSENTDLLDFDDWDID